MLSACSNNRTQFVGFIKQHEQLRSTISLTLCFRETLYNQRKICLNRVINNCMSCRFWKVKPKIQQTGDLPSDRVNRSSLYKSIGTDLMGSFINTRKKQRRVMSEFLMVWQPEQCALKLFSQ